MTDQQLKNKIENSLLKNEKNFKNKIYFNWLETKLGLMIAIFDDKYLYLLQFIDSKHLLKQIESLKPKLQAFITWGTSKISEALNKQLTLYFNKKIKSFDIPLKFTGTKFQEKVWLALTKIHYGKIVSYKEIAKIINKPNSYRAVGSANGSNKIALIIPCHRVLNNNGKFGGFSSGLNKKVTLINLEKNN